MDSAKQAEQILQWLSQEMAYRPQGHLAGEAPLPSLAAVQRLCRGNMVMVWNELLKRVRAERTVRDIRRNILLHGTQAETSHAPSATSPQAASRQEALADRAAAAAEAARLKEQAHELEEDLRHQMRDLAQEESAVIRDEKDAGSRKCQVAILEAYEHRCREAVLIFEECCKRLSRHVEHVRASRRRSKGTQVHKDSPYTLISQASQEDPCLITPAEQSIQEICQSLNQTISSHIGSTVPDLESAHAPDGFQNPSDCPLSVLDGPLSVLAERGVKGVPEGVLDKVKELLKDPQGMLKAMAEHTAKVTERLRRETDRIDVRADAERLRYEYESGNIHDKTQGDDSGVARSAERLLQERQQAHADQALMIEEAILAAEDYACEASAIASRLSEGNEDLEAGVWATERCVAGATAAVASLEAAVARLRGVHKERKQAEAVLRAKWQQIMDFEETRERLESLQNAVIRQNMAAAVAQQRSGTEARALGARHVAPLGPALRQLADQGRDTVEKERCAFVETPQRRLPPVQAKGLTDAQEQSALHQLTAVASGRLEALTLLQRAELADISNSAADSASSADSVLQSVLKALSFCHLAHEAPANLVPDVAGAIQEAETLSALIVEGHQFVAEAASATPALNRTVAGCSAAATAQDTEAETQWLPRLQEAGMEAREALVEAEHVRSLIEEWWEQPAATAVPWVDVGGQNVAQWLARVRQLQASLRTRAELQNLERLL